MNPPLMHKVYHYGYDILGQLTNASARLPNGDLWDGYQFSYAYDLTGNPLEQNRNGLVYSNSFNTLNQNVETRFAGALAALGNYTSPLTATVSVNNVQAKLFNDEWAAAGIPFVQGTNTLVTTILDLAGRTTSTTTSVTVADRTYAYDANGNMTANGAFTYVWDDENRLSEVWKSGTLVQQNLCDANGNITDLVDTNGAVVAHYEYDPYGNTIAQSSDQADANPFRFSSKYWDGETGFYDYGYRYYSPSMGRWINRDPIEEEGGGNLYAFINNTQINHTDPFGLVGTITVTTFDPYTNDSWFWHTRGWWFTAIWKPPSGGDWDKPCECKPCTKALWLQRAKWSLRRPYLPDIAVGMHDEWTEEEAGDYGNIWDCSSSNAGMGDRPSFGVAILSTVSSWLFVANSYVKCVEGKDAGTVYGGVWWSARWKHDTVFGSGPLIY